MLILLPRELRDIITLAVLTSPTGKPTLAQVPTASNLKFLIQPVSEQRGDVSAPINLSLLTTCKQLYNECYELLWKHNTFVFSCSALSRSLLPPDAYLQIQHIALAFDILSIEFHQERALRELAVWAKCGSLKSFTLNLKAGCELRETSFLDRDHTTKMVFTRNIEALTFLKPDFEGVKKTFAAYTQGEDEYLGEIDYSPVGSLTEILLRVHSAFGVGDILVDATRWKEYNGNETETK